MNIRIHPFFYILQRHILIYSNKSELDRTVQALVRNAGHHFNQRLKKINLGFRRKREKFFFSSHLSFFLDLYKFKENVFLLFILSIRWW